MVTESINCWILSNITISFSLTNMTIWSNINPQKLFKNWVTSDVLFCLFFLTWLCHLYTIFIYLHSDQQEFPSKCCFGHVACFKNTPLIITILLEVPTPIDIKKGSNSYLLHRVIPSRSSTLTNYNLPIVNPCELQTSCMTYSLLNVYHCDLAFILSNPSYTSLYSHYYCIFARFEHIE